ncbi:PIF1-like helicase family protein [Leishmania donovani]|uniref:ATP-dependent DNA helicase n=1 Tax=Leishmania donovani TaxID=5661 RepID=A0A504XXN4_LEIDO|nr:PIF1-like helicase family protein [Leishmania donovani]
MGPLVSAPGLLASLSVPRPAVLRQRTPAQLMRTAHPEAKYFARGGRQERQPKLHRRRAAVRGGGAAGGSLNTRAAAHAAADAEGAHSVHGVYSNVRGAARHHVTVSGTAATGARDRDAVLLRLSDSDTAQDGLRPGGVTRECTTTAVAAPKAAVSTSTLPPPRVPPTALRTAVSVVVGSGADPRDNSENLQNPRPPQTSSVMLDPTQAKAVDLAVRGFNIFVTGGAGTGKSQTLRAIVAALRSREVHESEETLRAVASAADSPQRGGSGRRAGARESDVAREEGRSVQRGFAEPSPPSRLSELSRATTSASRSSPRSSSAARAVPALSSVCATATTGLAAMQLHGVAINTFAGVGPGRGTPGQPLRMVQKNAEAAQRWRRCRVLLIDEVSMPEASLLEPLDYIAHRVRRCTNVPSGGMQVILCGVSFQLPPIAGRGGLWCWRTTSSSRPLWTRRRKRLVQLLALKVGTRVLLQCNVAPRHRLINGSVVILPTTVEDASPARRLPPATPDRGGAPPPLASWAQQLLRRGGFGCGSDVLACVETFQTMDRCRDNREAMGTSCVDVELGKAMEADKGGASDDVASRSERAAWGAEGSVTVSAASVVSHTQIPLRHAWALTIHKSQGLTLQPVQVDMANIRTPGQAYVALSLAPSLDQLTIFNFDPMAVTTSAAGTPAT